MKKTIQEEGHTIDEPQGNPMSRILITDDSADIRQLLSAILAEEGHKVIVAADGAKALELMEKELPEILVLDLMMPNLDGYGVLKEMAERNLLGGIKVLILTAKTSEADWVRGYKLGADMYLTKPFGTDELIESIELLMKSTKEELRQRTDQELDKAQLLSRLESIFQEF